MKKFILFSFFIVFIIQVVISQAIFPNPDGPEGTLSNKTKHISYNVEDSCISFFTWTFLRKKKQSSKNRRFTFVANFSDDSWNDPNKD